MARLALLVLPVAGCLAQAGPETPPDRITLVDGQVLEGRVLGYQNGDYEIERDGGITRVPLDRIGEVVDKPTRHGNPSAGSASFRIHGGLLELSADVGTYPSSDLIHLVGVHVGGALGIGVYSGSGAMPMANLAAFVSLFPRSRFHLEGLTGPAVVFNSGTMFPAMAGGLYFTWDIGSHFGLRAGGIGSVGLGTDSDAALYGMGWFPDVSASFRF